MSEEKKNYIREYQKEHSISDEQLLDMLIDWIDDAMLTGDVLDCLTGE